MCGITVYISKENFNENDMKNVAHRGPDDTTVLKTIFNDYTISFVFHRLAIIDVEHGQQPFIYKNNDNDGRIVYLVCNGEIYNYLDIINKNNFQTKSDCHVILDLYIKYGIFKTLTELDGEFAFVLVDLDKDNGMKIYSSRDRFGIRPLFFTKDENGVYFSSELKGLPFEGKGKQLEPRNIYYFKENLTQISVPYYEIGKNKIDISETVYGDIRNALFKSVNDRLQSERPIGALLSGGLDSSLICGIASKILATRGQRLNTFTIGMDIDSPDILHARNVAKHINSIHREIIIPVHVWIKTLSKVIRQIETTCITTIRASTAQYLISKWISENTDIKVILNGDGSDELTAGYLYFFNAPDHIESHNENLLLLNQIHYYDVLRVDRGISAFGLESRVPFLSHHFVDLYLSIDPSLRNPIKGERVEKFLLRKSFEDENIIPSEVLWRQKEAFSDAVSNKRKSWFEYIKEYVETQVDDNVDITGFPSKEAFWYYKIFKEYYPNCANITPNWLPKWCGGVTDPSARILVDLHE